MLQKKPFFSGASSSSKTAGVVGERGGRGGLTGGRGACERGFEEEAKKKGEERKPGKLRLRKKGGGGK